MPPMSVMPGAGGYPQAVHPQANYPQSAYPQAYAPNGYVPNQPVPVGQAQRVAPAANRPIPVTPGMAARPAAVGRPVPVNGHSAKQPQAVTSAARPANRPVGVAAGPVAVRELSPEEQAEVADEKPLKALNATPPWLVSLLVHVVILLLMALIFFTPKFTQLVEVEIRPSEIFAEKLGEQLKDEFLTTPLSELKDAETVLTPDDLQQVDDPLAAPPEVDIMLDASSSMSNLAAPTIGMALSGREKGSKSALLAAYGGNATTEAAVKSGLEWLKKNQRKDGSWSLIGPYQDGGSSENSVAATAMALLAFQGAGHTDREGEFAKVVDNGWKYLLKQQDKDGSFLPKGTAPDHHNLYTHAQATIALCELYGMTKDSKYRDQAQQAVKFCVSSQSSEGGWRYHPKQDADTSVTGWFVMALQSAMMAKLEVPSTTLADISKFLDSVAIDGGRRYSYRVDSHETDAVSAEGLLCRQYLGWKQDDPRLIEGIERVVTKPVNYSDQNVYYWYYATQAAHHMEGELWDRWNRVMRQEVPKAQAKSGPEAGSWSPMLDEWGARGAGRLYTTCLSIYMLEVYYRHLPIYAEVYKYKLQQF